MMLHHISIRTADIHRSIAFYEKLGFEIEERFATGYTLACWMLGELGRLELIEIPNPKDAPDAFIDERYVGYYHISFDLSNKVDSLISWLTELKQKTTFTILLEPQQQIIGKNVYEVAFISDPDGLPLEFLIFQAKNIYQ
jgi:catechol 2,3-dioxygenase-like lactoylglutathione lyase family enzyme